MSNFQLSVCPHDTAKNTVAWFILNTYMQRHLGFGIHFEPKDNFIQERQQVLEGSYQIVYANPFSAAIFMRDLGFIPVARPVGIFDETLLVKGKGKQLPNDRNLRIASATDKLAIHSLGLTLLPGLGIDQNMCDFEFVGTHVKAAQSVMKEQADLGFVFNETWNGLAAKSRDELEIVSQTQQQHAFHCFCISPEWADKREQVQKVLCDMKDDPKGKSILDELQFHQGFEPIDASHMNATLVLT